MTKPIHSRFVASISDLKKNPMETVKSGQGDVVAILNRNTPAFYCIPADLYDEIFEILEDQYLMRVAMERDNEPSIEVSVDDL
ncbi:plasmid stabilization protein [Neisseria sp. N95_16]|uniref:Uncharacterized protein n=1 Tax=Neisseria brasiliensis TaxID=2666100 RepID=A0A5Q3S294_9NEIS|nr:MULTISPECIES: plasmid stabilization protein [Neisseria]MRN37713.1 hypothetical protein [Neisseria brasiliensis]PJO09781.1 plasmid stabilization protein [Neisseria sp. N95_16]PJO79214.1 plasmid stabilization protein [Neisseria sp. N177_16]QGL24676.1 hypothetical protein GJV52_03455 [Neisseria brasiliensis]